jgi:uncharacterized coiled-coil protein SlyX
MNYSKKLNQIRLLLGMEIKMAEYILEDGVTKLVCDGELRPGSEVSVISEAGETGPAPQGTHRLQDGTVITVDEASKIISVEKPEMEIEVEAQEEVVDEVKDEVKEDKVEVEELRNVLMALAQTVEEMANEIRIVKEDMASYKAKTEKMSKTPASNKISTFNTESTSDTHSTFDLQLEAIEKMKETVKNKFKIK